MKMNPSVKSISAVLAVFALAATIQVGAQVTTTSVSSTTSAGTVSALDGQTISVTTEKSTAPVSYHFSEKTTFVDETGAVVSREVIKSGVPVTVYYSNAGDAMTASKVVVQKAAPAAVVDEEKTTTTTTTVE